MGKSAAWVAAVAVTAGLVPAGANAADWLPTASGNQNWNNAANWSGVTPPATFPNAPGEVVNIKSNIVGAQTINLPSGGISIGTLNIGDVIDTGTPANNFAFTIGSNSLIFDNGASEAVINKTGLGAGSVLRDTISSAVTLNSPLLINAVASDSSTANSVLRFQGSIGGNFGLTKDGNGSISLNLNNTYTGLTLIKAGRIRMEGSANVNAIPGDVEIRSGATLQAAQQNVIKNTANINLPEDTSIPNNGNNGGFVNPGFNGVDNSTDGKDVTGSIIAQNIGSLEGTANGSQVGGGGRGTLTIGGNNLNKTFNGRMGGRTSFVKVGTGVQTLGGTLNSWQTPTLFPTTGGQPVQRHFTVLGGRVDLNKTEHVSSIAQGLLNIGDGTQTGAQRPEVRLLQSHQIAVQNFDEVAENETTVLKLNNGIFNTFGNDETVGSLALAGSGLNTIDLGVGTGSVLNFLAPGTWSPTALLEVTNWGGLPTGSGLDQLFIGGSAVLTSDQLAAISFVNPEELLPGTYGAMQLATGEVVAAVPEPAALAALGLGSLALLARPKRRP